VNLAQHIGQYQTYTQLDAGARLSSKGAHLDPDLLGDARPRKPGWRPALGQIGAAGGHLRNQGVKAGDLFLFYGWFGKTELTKDRLRFSPDSPGFHAIFGYLEVEQVIAANGSVPLPDWLSDHSHAVAARLAKSTNFIYVAKSTLSADAARPGAGVFRFNENLVLTQRGMSRSRWKLDPRVFQHLEISYHSASSWMNGYFQSYPRAQEYVVKADEGAANWARALICMSDLWWH
jgi:Nucleotide modification associated domain 3